MADTLNLPFIAALLSILTIVYSYFAPAIAPHNPPNTPVTVPYLVPWIGSFFTFKRDPLRFLKECHLRYGKSYKIYAAGNAVVVITNPDGIAFISRNGTGPLDHKVIFTRMLRGIADFGASVDFVQDLLDSKIFPIVKTALSPASLSGMTGTVDVLLSRELNALVRTSESHPVSFNLSELIGRPIYNAGSHSLFGPTFPLDSYRDFIELDSHLPQLLTGIPFIAQRGRRARLRMLSMFEKYINAWWNSDGSEDIPEASATVMLSLAELKASQVTRRDAAGTLLLYLWGFHSNMWYMMFWLLAHIVVDKTSMARMVADIGFFLSKHSLDKLNDPNCIPPLLESALQETLRWATTSTTARYATEDTAVIVDGVPVPIFKGECVVGDIRAVHHDPQVYEDPYKFKFDRYLVNGENIPKPSPWGRGKHMCAGRHLAIHIMRRFTVELLSSYTVSPAKLQIEEVTIPPISIRHFLGSLKSTKDIQITLVRRA